MSESDRDRTTGPIVHLLDVGTQDYGDAVLCRFGRTTVLIDGAHSANIEGEGRQHPSIQAQLQRLLHAETPVRVTLLVVSHAHADHIGCLPKLVEQDLLRADWALVADPDVRWGSPSDARRDAPGEALAQALLEETPDEPRPDDLKRLLADAARQESAYREMLATLEARGTRVVRYDGTEDPDLLAYLKDRGVTLRILGPSKRQLESCAALIGKRSDEMRDVVTDLLPAADLIAGEPPPPDHYLDVYRTIIEQIALSPDAMDAFKKDKGAINDTSIVTAFEYREVKSLFTGDMQLVDPEVSDEDITAEIAKLVKRIRTAGPWDFVKLSHHGSYNGFSDKHWLDIGKPRYLGLCTGAGSTKHPNPQVLEDLKERRNEVTWVRTDRNGQTTLAQGPDWEIETTRGKLNDPRPNREDQAEPTITPIITPSPPRRVESPEPLRAPQPVLTDGENRVEVRTFVPMRPARVAVTIDVLPAGTHEASYSSPRSEPPILTEDRPQGPLLLGGGQRRLPKLLVVTNRDMLIRNIGAEETRIALESIKAAGHDCLEDLPSEDATGAIGRVRRQLNQSIDYAGVLILGGYDVVRPQILDALPAQTRAALKKITDPDNFIVWCDDAYGDRDGDGMPEVPVTRIPDGHSSELVFAALQAPAGPGSAGRSGIRNQLRPFADEIYEILPGDGQMLQSGPQCFDEPAYSLAAPRVYMMLHGNDRDGTRFWGEEAGEYPIAMTLANIPANPGMVAFTGCCWGALAGQPRANRLSTGMNPRARVPEASIALQFLARGARAFIGCTGVHYSPDPDEESVGGPMHRFFWKSFEQGTPPAKALLEAKHQYLQWLARRDRRPALEEAIELKILKEFTCLGLGW